MSLQLLEDIHIRAVRFIFNVKESNFDTDVLTATKWKLIAFSYKKRMTCITYRAFYKGASGGINSLFTLKYSLLRYYRDNLKLYVQPPKSDLLRSSFSNRASMLWNNLGAFLKSKPNLESFKCALKANSGMLDETSFNGI